MRKKYTAHILVVGIVLAFTAYFIFSATYSNLPKNTNVQPRVKFSLGETETKFNHPLAVAVAEDRRVYVSDSGNNQIKVFKSSGKFLFYFGGSGKGPGQFDSPYGVGIMPDGSVLVSDMLNYRIQRFNKDGKFMGIFVPESIGIKPGMLMVSGNEVFVSDLVSQQVVVLDLKGKVLRKYGSGMNFPQGLAVLSNKLLVADAGNNRIKLFSDINKPVSQGTFGTKQQFKLLRGLAVDNLNRVLAVDSMRSEVEFISEKGDSLFIIGSIGSGQDQFMYPAGIAIDRYGNIFIADWGNNRVQVWGY